MITAHFKFQNSNCLAPAGWITAVVRQPKGLCHHIWMPAYTCKNVTSYHSIETFLLFQKRFGWTGARTTKQSLLITPDTSQPLHLDLRF